MDWRGFLERPALPAPSAEALETVASEKILITGAGGSIGSALALRLAAHAPRQPLLMESSESRLFALQYSFRRAAPDCLPNLILGNVLDRSLLDELFDLHQPGVVFHAAACKQVPLLEAQPFAAIETNVFGTHSLARAATRRGARLILLSTDKAVEPASVMGATKRVAELIVLESGGTVLRLGNVLASSGSVAESFAAQIACGGPLTVTGPAARRYFLTIGEAVNLLIHACSERAEARLLVPMLPTQHAIANLARFMANELAPGREIALEFTAPRPGDKTSEKLFGSGERIDGIDSSGLQSLFTPTIGATELQRTLTHLRSAFDARDLPAALANLQSLVPDYTPSTILQSLAAQQAGRAKR